MSRTALFLAVAILVVAVLVIAAEHPPARPYSCRLLDDEQKKCAFGLCDRRAVDRLTKECWRDGGRP